MIFGIYDPPCCDVNVQRWSDLKIGDICDALEFNYEKYFCGAGPFTLVIPRNSVFAEKIGTGCFLIKPSDGGEERYDGFIVKNIVYENDTLKITGYDLNGLLIDRITLYPQEYADKAIREGSTEEIVKYYVDYNCVSSTDEERNFPRLEIAENQNRGIANDAASPRLECVADVIADILGAQNMGYRITPLLNVVGGTAALMEFEVYEAVDRTQNQSENSRVTFSFGLGNIAQMKREVGVTADKNTFYCEIGSGAVQRYYKKGEDDEGEAPEEEKIISGYDRREEYLKLSCELGEIQVYAEHEIADRYRLTDSLDITAGNPLDYGSIYNVGDIVTVYDRERKLQLDSIISAAEIKRTGTEYSVKITLGESKPKVLDSYAKKGQATASSVRSTFGVGRPSDWDNTSEYFNRYSPKNGNIAGIEGQKNCYAHAEGFDTKAMAQYAHSEGLQTKTSGGASHVEGYKNEISGNYSHAEGMQNTQTNVQHAQNAFAVHLEGYSNTITSDAPRIHIEGGSNKAASDTAHVEGYLNNENGGSDYAHVEGMQNTMADSQAGHIEGQGNTVAGSSFSHTEGYSNTLESAPYAHAGGQSNTIRGAAFSCAEGMSNTLTGGSSNHTEGMYNKIAGGTANHAAGMSNTIENASFSSVGGMSSTITGGSGHFAHGVGLEISGENAPASAAFGRYNENSSELIFMIGSGTGDNDRKNAFAIDSDGNIYITGDIFINGVKLNSGGNQE